MSFSSSTLKSKKINIFSFFAGAGFLDFGFEKEGSYEVVYVNEYSQLFNQIYQYSRKKIGLQEPLLGHHVCGIENIDTHELTKMVDEQKSKSLTGFIGGPPCPDFSVAGKNKGREGKNGQLSQTYVNLICRVCPDFFFFENVKGLYRTCKHKKFFDELCLQLNQNGYLLTHRILNALEYGVPQDRERLILIGVRQDLAVNMSKQFEDGWLTDFPWETSKKYSLNTIKKCEWPVVDELILNGDRPEPQGIIKDLTVQYWWEKNNVNIHPDQCMCFKPRSMHKFNTIKEGDVGQMSFKRLHRWRYAPTSAYGNNEVHLHPYEPRRISVAEALAIQSLPPEYEIPKQIPLSAAFKTIGNGVPFLLALNLAKTIKKYLSYGSEA